jgi:hypothetical protein
MMTIIATSTAHGSQQPDAIAYLYGENRGIWQHYAGLEGYVKVDGDALVAAEQIFQTVAEIQPEMRISQKETAAQ